MKKLYILLGIVVITSYSCRKDLNAPPGQARVEGHVVYDQNSAEVALNGAYNRFSIAGTVLGFNSTTWAQYHEIPGAMLSGWLLYFIGRAAESNNAVLPASSTGYWSHPYALLNAANAVIAEVGALDESMFSGNRKKEILAEARFLRAYAHTNLLGYFGEWYKPESPYGVMLRKSPLQLTNAAQKRSSVMESFEYILQDIDYAIENAADRRPVFYANKTAARALKMRVLMLHGQLPDYTEVIKLADEILINSDYQLEPSLRDLMQVKGLTSKEVILGVTPFPNQPGKRWRYEFVSSSLYLASPEFRQLLANDPRETWMYKKGVPPPAPSLVRDSTLLTKFYGPKVEDSYVFRLTEVYLMKAEAIVRSGGELNDAKAILKTVKSKSGVTDFSAIDDANTPLEMEIELYKEYVCNMMGEDGIEWFALLRLPFETVTKLRPTIKSRDQYILPIPSSEFSLNPAIGEQNPGYSK